MAAVTAGWRDLSIGETGSDNLSPLAGANLLLQITRLVQLQSDEDPARDVFPGNVSL